MKIRTVEAFAFQAERDLSPGTGTAGSPAPLKAAASHYRWAETYPVLYSTRFETALVRITLEDGTYGWGEAQAPVAPEVACAIIEQILKPVLEGQDFEPTPEGVSQLWWTMYSTMRVRGQTGGFMLDAIAGIDLALWDLAGKLTKKSVGELLGSTRTSVPAYLSGLPAGDPESVTAWHDTGISTVKVFFQSEKHDTLLRNCDRVQQILGPSGRVAADALWRLTPATARALAPELEARGILFLEAPLAPESAVAHGELAREIRTPLALGESYRTIFELEPFFIANAMQIVQPDLGRTGITEGLRIAAMAREHGVSVIPHVSIAMGPQLAAAIHFAAASACPLLEFNPNVVGTANAYLTQPVTIKNGHYLIPEGPGLGIDLHAFEAR